MFSKVQTFASEHAAVIQRVSLIVAVSVVGLIGAGLLYNALNENAEPQADAVDQPIDVTAVNPG